jgi:hypothetical protein
MCQRISWYHLPSSLGKTEKHDSIFAAFLEKTERHEVSLRKLT